MEEDMFQMPGYRTGEYLLILNPHEDLKNKITDVRKSFYKNFKDAKVFGGKPNVALAKFVAWDMMEEKILNRIKIVAMGTSPFKVMLKDYGSLPSHTIYINIITKVPVNNLVKELRAMKRLLKSPDVEPYFLKEPHITIASKLNPGEYDRAWTEYSQKNFTGSFIADGMLLLKRRPGERAYQVVQKFEFMNLPVATRQGELFA